MSAFWSARVARWRSTALWHRLVVPPTNHFAKGGLRRIRNRLEQDAGTDFAQFRDTFNAISKRATVERNMPPMVHNVIAALAAAWDMKRLAAPKGGEQ